MQLYDLLAAFTGGRTFGRPDPTLNRPAPPSWSAPGRRDFTQPTTRATRADRYIPETQVSKPNDQPTRTDKSPVSKQPDGTYYYRREARLDYQLDLRFDLAAIAHTAQRVAEGDVAAVNRLMAGGFGLSAEFSASGYEKIATNMVEQEQDQPVNRITKQLMKNQSTMAIAQRFAQQDRAFALDGFYNEASRVRRSLHESVREGHRRTTNRIAIRFQTDSQFSFALAERFNVQTQQVAEKRPDSIGSYLDSAGKVADTGTADMMSAFFDAVEGYLADSESAMVQKVERFFTMAAEELGFDSSQVAIARERLLGSIESFFDRVDGAMDTLQVSFDGVPSSERNTLAPPPPLPETGHSQFQSQLALA